MAAQTTPWVSSSSLPDAVVRYKGLTDLIGPVLEWLSRGVG